MLLKQGSDAVARLTDGAYGITVVQHLNYKGLSSYQIEHTIPILMFCARPHSRDRYHLSQKAVSCCLCHQHGIPTTSVVYQTRILAHTEHQDQ